MATDDGCQVMEKNLHDPMLKFIENIDIASVKMSSVLLGI